MTTQFDPRDIEELWKQTPKELQHEAQQIVKHYYKATNRMHSDGSWGAVEMTPGQLLDLVVYLLKKGKE